MVGGLGANVRETKSGSDGGWRRGRGGDEEEMEEFGEEVVESLGVRAVYKEGGGEE